MFDGHVRRYGNCHTWSAALPGSTRLLVSGQMPAPAAVQAVLRWLVRQGLLDPQVAAQPAEDESAAEAAVLADAERSVS